MLDREFGERGEKLEENLFPVQGGIYRKGERGYLGVVPDRVEGGTCRKRDSVELVLNRRLNSKDSREPADFDIKVNNRGRRVELSHRVVAGLGEDSDVLRRI